MDEAEPPAEPVIDPLQRAISDLASAHIAAIVAIAQIPDPRARFDAAGQVANRARGWADNLADTRAGIAAQVYRDERLTTVELGELLGISFGRAAELVRTAEANHGRPPVRRRRPAAE